MPVHIKSVSADIRAPAAPSAAPAMTPSPGGVLGKVTDAELRERLRPIVMEILNTELEALLRQRG
jgi:hypothetical protein